MNTESKTRIINDVKSEALKTNPIFNQYFKLKIKLLFLLFKKGKITFKKIFNAIFCLASYYMSLKKTGTYPFIINFELWNECNESCVFCRDENGVIDNINQNEKDHIIKKDKMDIKIYEKVIDECKDYLMMSVPYINGEPLLSKDIYHAIEYANKNKIGTLISSNGIILNKRNSERLLKTGLDFLKVHISGMTNEVHNIEHRKGNVETILKNLEYLSEFKKNNNYETLIMLDYISYKHNQHEIEQAKEFAKKNNLIFNLRAGHGRGLEHLGESSYDENELPLKNKCVWLWTTLATDYDGSVYPCCAHTSFSNAKGYGILNADNNSKQIKKFWNSEYSKEMKKIHVEEGRAPIDICSRCPRKSISFEF